MNEFQDYTWEWMINDKERRKKLYDILYPYIEEKEILEMNCGFSPLNKYLKKGFIFGFDKYKPAIDLLKKQEKDKVQQGNRQDREWFLGSSKEFCLGSQEKTLKALLEITGDNIEVFALLGICEGQEHFDPATTPEDIYEAQSANTLISMYKPEFVILEKADYKNPINLQRIQNWIKGFYILIETKRYSVTDSDRTRQRTVWIYRRNV